MGELLQLPPPPPPRKSEKRVDPYRQLAEFHARVLPPATGSNSLAHLAHRVRVELEGIKRGALHAITAGELLIEAKSLTKHGQWEDWCKSAGLSPRTAQHYMRLAKHRDAFKSANLADLTVTFALATLAPPKPEPAPEPAPPPPLPKEAQVDVSNVDHNAHALTEMVDRAIGVLLPPKVAAVMYASNDRAKAALRFVEALDVTLGQLDREQAGTQRVLPPDPEADRLVGNLLLSLEHKMDPNGLGLKRADRADIVLRIMKAWGVYPETKWETA